MNAEITIPSKTQERLAHPAQPGERHAQIVKIAAALLSSGLNANAVFHQIRPRYDADVPDTEITAVIRWAEKRFQTQPGRTHKCHNRSEPHFHKPLKSEKPPVFIDSETAVKRFLNGFTCEKADIWEASPVRLPEKWEKDPETLFTALYSDEENINIVSDFTVSDGKASPKGYGVTHKCSYWGDFFRGNQLRGSNAGAWVRPNPTDGKGISDQNVTAFRFALVEFDSIPISLQLPFIARLPIPVAVVLTSGGKSLHAWISIGAKDATAYANQVSILFALLSPFGIDTANRNPSRLSRLVGVTRLIGGVGDNRQRLLYLNPNAQTGRILS